MENSKDIGRICTYTGIGIGVGAYTCGIGTV